MYTICGKYFDFNITAVDLYFFEYSNQIHSFGGKFRGTQQNKDFKQQIYSMSY